MRSNNSGLKRTRRLASAVVGLCVSSALPLNVTAQTPSASVPIHATLNQLMRAVQFPLSNVIFSAQLDDPAAIKEDMKASAATDPLRSVFGGWQAVENSALGLAESATLLTIPGRVCANGTPVPVQNADWIRFVQGLRDAGTAAYRAAQSKSQDKILEVSEQVANSCSNCHQVYRKAGARGANDMTARCKP
jgi:hypothetical protein